MEATAELPTVQPRKRKRRINKGLAGVLAANTDQTWDEIAPQVGAKNGNSLKTSMLNSGLTKAILNDIAAPKVKATLTASIVSEASEIVRERLNSELLLQTSALGQRKPTLKGLASRGQGRAATVKQIAETWRTLNGNPDSVTISFGATSLSDAVPAAKTQPVVEVSEVQSTPVSTAGSDVHNSQ